MYGGFFAVFLFSYKTLNLYHAQSDMYDIFYSTSYACFKCYLKESGANRLANWTCHAKKIKMRKRWNDFKESVYSPTWFCHVILTQSRNYSTDYPRVASITFRTSGKQIWRVILTYRSDNLITTRLRSMNWSMSHTICRQAVQCWPMSS